MEPRRISSLIFSQEDNEMIPLVSVLGRDLVVVIPLFSSTSNVHYE